MRAAALSLEKECKTLREKLDRSTSALTAAEKKASDLSTELAQEKKRNVDLTADTTLLKEETDAAVASLKEELVDAASRYTWMTKARLMKQFLDGQTASWTPEADVRQFLEVFGTLEDLLPEGTDAADTMATADSYANAKPTDAP